PHALAFLTNGGFRRRTQPRDQQLPDDDEAEQGGQRAFPASIHDEVEARHRQGCAHRETRREQERRPAGIGEPPDRQPQAAEVKGTQSRTGDEGQNQGDESAHRSMSFSVSSLSIIFASRLTQYHALRQPSVTPASSSASDHEKSPGHRRSSQSPANTPMRVGTAI